MSKFSQSEVDAVLNEPDDDAPEMPDADTSTATAGDEPEAVAESPAPEQTDTSEQAPVAEEAQPITRDDGAKWSETAKRWYKDGKIVAGEPPAAPVEASNPSTPQAPALEAPKVEPPKAEAPAGDPWQIRAGGSREKVAVPGASIMPDGKLVVAPEFVGRHRDIVAAGIQHLSNYGREKAQYMEQIREAEARGQAHGAKYNKASVYLWDKLSSVLAEHPQELDLIRRELAIELKSADLEIPKAQPVSEPAPEQIEQAFSVGLGSYVDELFEDAPRGVLSPEDIQDIRTAIGARMAAYAAEVDGQIMLDTHAVKRDFDREIGLIQRAHQREAAAREQAKKAQQAAAFNTANTPKSPAPTPRKPTPTPAHAAPSGKKPGWDQSFNSVWKDDGDDE